MAWTNPRTWNAGEMVTASMLNTHIRDNLNSLRSEHHLLQTFRGLRLRTHPDFNLAASRVWLKADEIVMSDGTRLSNWDGQTADITVSGANGLDTGSEAASTRYEVHAIAKDDGTKGLLLHKAKSAPVDQSQTAQTTNSPLRFGATTNVKEGQSFKPGTTGPLDAVDILMFRAGNPAGRVWLTIEADSSGSPSGTPLATSDKLDANAFSTSSQWVQFIFRSPATLTSGTTYYIVLQGDYTTSAVNYVSWHYSAGGSVYANGQFYGYDGTTWTSSATADYTFKTHTRLNDSVPTMPTGYTKNTKVGYVYNDGSSNFDAFIQTDRRAQLLNDHLIVNGSTSTIEVLTDLATVIPYGPTKVWAAGQNTTNGASVCIGPVPDAYDMRSTTLRNNVIMQQPAAANSMVVGFSSEFHTEMQAMYFRVGAGTGYVWITGYELVS